MPIQAPTETKARLGRRACLRLLAAAGGGSCFLRLPGCAYYEAEDGAAFSAWDFPGPAAAPQVIAARAALLAASPHNTQPWALHVTAESIALYADFDRHLGAMDSLRRELHVGLGCALENIVIAGAATGRSCQVTLLPDAAQPNLVAHIGLREAAPAPDALFDAIARRHTNRGPYLERQVPSGLQRSLQALLSQEASAVSLNLLTSPSERARFRDETIAATQAIIDDAEMSSDSAHWYRHTRAEIEQHRDGTTLDATGAGAVTRFVAKSLGRPSERVANDYWLSATKERQTTGSAFGILSSTSANTRASQISVGRVFQRLQLWAATQGLAMQPLNQLAERQDREESAKLAPRFSASLATLMATGERRAQMLFRIGYAADTAFASPRRPLEWVRV